MKAECILYDWRRFSASSYLFRKLILNLLHPPTSHTHSCCGIQMRWKQTWAREYTFLNADLIKMLQVKTAQRPEGQWFSGSAHAAVAQIRRAVISGTFPLGPVPPLPGWSPSYILELWDLKLLHTVHVRPTASFRAEGNKSSVRSVNLPNKLLIWLVPIYQWKLNLNEEVECLWWHRWNQCLKLWGPVIYYQVVIVMSWRGRKHRITVNNQARGFSFILWSTGKKNRFTMTQSREVVWLRFERKMNFLFKSSYPQNCLEQESSAEWTLGGFLPAPHNVLFLWWSSTPEDFLFLILNLQTVSHSRFMVIFQIRWLTIWEKMLTSVCYWSVLM